VLHYFLILDEILLDFRVSYILIFQNGCSFEKGLIKLSWQSWGWLRL